MRRSDLAEKVGVSPSGVTRILDARVKRVLVEKEDNPSDDRVSLVVLSKAGKKITEEAKISFEYDSSALFESLEKEELSTLSELLKVLTK